VELSVAGSVTAICDSSRCRFSSGVASDGSSYVDCRSGSRCAVDASDTTELRCYNSTCEATVLAPDANLTFRCEWQSSCTATCVDGPCSMDCASNATSCSLSCDGSTYAPCPLGQDCSCP
jgi:hypothetical protein